MYDIAVATSACLRSGTRVDVAWVVSADLGVPLDLSEAVGLTPGGGRLGSLLGGALDDRLARATAGRLHHFEVTDLEAAAHGLGRGGTVSVLLVAADQLPGGLWPALLAREPVGVVVTLDGDAVTGAALAEPDADVAVTQGAGWPARPAKPRHSARDVRPDAITSTFVPVPRLVVLGQGAIVDAIAQVGAVVGWKVTRSAEPSRLMLLAEDLTHADSLVVLSHDIEAAVAVLGAGLDGGAGYIGALGSQTMQGQRAAWLREQGYADLSRIHGPAGLDIGASGPGEIAVAVLLCILVRRSQNEGSSGLCP
jgi:xanthine dehydrogenase accessory factor